MRFYILVVCLPEMVGTTDIEKNMSSGNNVNGASGKLLPSRHLSQKGRLAVLILMLLYGNEIWVCKMEQESKINAV